MHKKTNFKPKELPIVNYKGENHFVDFRLEELRNVKTVKPTKFTELKDENFKSYLRGIRFRTHGQEYMKGLD